MKVVQNLFKSACCITLKGILFAYVLRLMKEITHNM